MFRFCLEKYSGPRSRYECPGCGKMRNFTRYIDSYTGQHLHPAVGLCDRINSCGYHYPPKMYFADNGIRLQPEDYLPRRPIEQWMAPSKELSFIPLDKFEGSLKAYEENKFVQNLIRLFGLEITMQAVTKYHIGTSNCWGGGATVFWQIDLEGKVRTGKIMLYNLDTGKRVTDPYNHVNWVHRRLRLEKFHLKQCLFGEHLLQKDPSKTVAVVESEKTAVIASAYLPQFIWVAVGSLNNLKVELLKAIAGRKVLLFPDLGSYQDWYNKVQNLPEHFRFSVSDLLERYASDAERKQGLDLADYLVQKDLNQFLKM